MVAETCHHRCLPHSESLAQACVIALWRRDFAILIVKQVKLDDIVVQDGHTQLRL